VPAVLLSVTVNTWLEQFEPKSALNGAVTVAVATKQVLSDFLVIAVAVGVVPLTEVTAMFVVSVAGSRPEPVTVSVPVAAVVTAPVALIPNE
jgi:hypothetical protein